MKLIELAHCSTCEERICDEHLERINTAVTQARAEARREAIIDAALECDRLVIECQGHGDGWGAAAAMTAAQYVRALAKEGKE